VTTLQSMIGVALAVSSLAAGPLVEPARQEQRVNPTGAAVQAFQKALADYVKVHNEAEAKVPNLSETKDPAKISAREAALGVAIKALRAGAKPGDIFVPEVQPVFIEAVRNDFSTRTAVDRKAMVEELPKQMTLTVNMVYPTTLPLATFPAKLLRSLPDLPPELEYRIVARHLILRDVKANLIVDFLRNVVPTIPS
jgi:hypothetical protein